MSGELKASGGSGRHVYMFLFKGATIANLSSVTLETYSQANYANYVLSLSEVGSTGIYEGDFPAGFDAGDYDIFVYEAVGGVGSEAQGDPFFSGSFTIHWTGTQVSESTDPILDTAKSLITLAEAKQYLKISSSADDSILAALLNGISVWVAGYLKRALVSNVYTEYYSGDGSNELQLKNWPIISLTSLNMDFLRTFDSSSNVDLTNLIIKKGSGILRSFNLLYGFQQGDSNIKVVYTAGYTVGANAGQGTMPYDIRLAVKRILEKQYRIGYTHRKLDYQSESISNMNVTFQVDDIPKDAKSLLDGYKSLIPVPQYEYAD